MSEQSDNFNQSNLSNRLRKVFKNKKLLLGVLISYLGLVLFALANLYPYQYYDSEKLIQLGIKVLPGVIILFGLGYLIYGYLEGSQPEKPLAEASNSIEIEKYLREFRRYNERLERQFEKGEKDTKAVYEKVRDLIEKENKLHLDQSQRSEIFNSLKKSISDNINDDFFKQLNENISIDRIQEKRTQIDLLLNDFDSIKKRLSNEIQELGRKANVNLVIGSLTTIIALFALGYVVFQNTDSFTSYADLVYHYIPRLSLIVFIEVFAFFFLRLYKLNLNDVKYFQNELTTVELKLSSLVTSINFGTEQDISSITQELSRTERNFILKKDETTVDLEKSRIAKTDLKDILGSVTEIIKHKK